MILWNNEFHRESFFTFRHCTFPVSRYTNMEHPLLSPKFFLLNVIPRNRRYCEIFEFASILSTCASHTLHFLLFHRTIVKFQNSTRIPFRCNSLCVLEISISNDCTKPFNCEISRFHIYSFYVPWFVCILEISIFDDSAKFGNSTFLL